jgi:hypothetical protein
LRFDQDELDEPRGDDRTVAEPPVALGPVGLRSAPERLLERPDELPWPSVGALRVTVGALRVTVGALLVTAGALR